MMPRLPIATSVLPALCLSVPAHAALPDPVKAMIEAAIAKGDKEKVATVVDLAKETNPDSAAEIDAMQADFLARKGEQEAQAAAAKKEAIRTAGLFENWHGKGEVGAYRATGNSDNTGFTGAITLERKGIDWSHKLRARADYQRANGATSREQYFAAYEPRYQISKNLFAYGLAQWERDTRQGYSARYALSSGIGYHVIDGDKVDLAIKAGPAYRVTDYVDGTSDKNLAALFGLDFDWRISDRLTLTQNTNYVSEGGAGATLIVDSNNTTLDLITGLEAKISDRLTTRFSYEVQYDSNPPAGKVKTDTQSRFTLVYGF